MANFEDRMCYSAAKTLMSSLDSLHSIHFEHGVIPDELITAMSKLNLNQQKALAERARYFIDVAIDSNALKRQLYELEESREERELEDTYLLHGAPLILMRRLFGIHASEFSRRRSILNIRGAGSGRPPLCDEETDHLVWELWLHHKQLDERERFLKIADETRLDLHLIWSALRDHIDS